MRRRLFNLLVLLSLLLCVGAGVLWARSYRVADGLSWSEGRESFYRPAAGVEYRVGRRHEVASAAGGITFVVDTGSWSPQHRRWFHEPAGPDWRIWAGRVRYGPPSERQAVLGFESATFTGSPPIASVGGTSMVLARRWRAPYWPLAAAAAVLPLWRLARWGRRRRRLTRGLCPRCGYDLRASEGACPECGYAVVRTAARPAERVP